MSESVAARLRAWARAVKRDVYALWLAARDPRVPWYAKALALGIAAYAFSPIDLIPDFIPVLGYLDDILLLPLAIRLIPPAIMEEHRARAAETLERPVSRAAACFIAGVWIAGAMLAGWFIWRSVAAPPR